jgi:glycosyltransferase involved in cell wall biosynthesis
MTQLTIFTPTYNRAFCLHKCYESLLKQTCQDFIWLIIDDGSTDHTRELVTGWMDESLIKIHYKWQENQGMHGAHNTAYDLIETELNVCIDSDDYMSEHAVEKIIAFWNEHGSDEVSGIVALDADTEGQLIGTALPESVNTSTLFNLYHQYGVTGDKKLIYRTALTKEYPYPLFTDEKYVGLAYKYYRLDIDYELLLLNEVVCHVDYLPEGSSHNMFYQYLRNPKGFSFYRKELMKLPFANRLFKFRQAIHYVSSSILSRNSLFLKETPARILTILALPFGILLNLYIKMKTRTT